MTRCFLILLLPFFFAPAKAQNAAAVDSMKTALAKATGFEEKFDLLKNLSKVMMNVNPAEADGYGNQLIEMAEESRDKKYIVTAYLENGKRSSFFAGKKEYINRAIDFYNKALAVAKENNLDEEKGLSQLSLSAIYLSMPDIEKSFQYVNDAFSLISMMKNDSLKTLANIAYGNVNLYKNEKIMALRHHLTALQIAEDMKDNNLVRNCYQSLSGFYVNIDAFDKAIDYSTAAYKQLDQIKEKNVPYQKAIDMNAIGALYSYKKNYEMAIYYYNRSLQMADSLKFATLKIPAYAGLLNLYLQMDQPEKALTYLNSAAGQNLRQYLSMFGFSKTIDQAYAVVYTETGKYDSARNRFLVATPYFEQGASEGNKLNFYIQLANFYDKTTDNKKAIDYFLKAKELALSMGSLESVRNIARHLDSLYARTGDYQASYKYNSVYYQFKDSVEKLNKEKDVAQVEAADEQQRLEKARKEEEENTRRKNNIQYMGITIGIAALFVIIVVLGMFKVSANTIRFIGFFAFLMFFEFIFLIFKKNIHSVTHGEPWKDLAFMIGLAAILVPLHHWLEEKVIHYLTSHNRLTATGGHLRSKLFKAAKSPDQ